MTRKTETTTNPGALKVFLLRLLQHPLITVTMVLILLAAIAAGSFVYRNILVAQGNKIATGEAQNFSDASAREINRFVEDKQQNLHNFANRPSVIQAFTEKDRVKIGQLESLITLLSRDITEGQLLFPNDQRLDQTRNFAAREMFFQAIQGNPPKPIAVKLAQGWSLLILYTINDPKDDQPIGALVATIALDSLQNRLTNLNAPGAISLEQTVPGIPTQTLLTTSTTNNSPIIVISNTDIPGWRISFTADQALIDASMPSLNELIQFVAVISIVTLLLLYLVARAAYNHYRHEPLPVAKKAKPRAVEKVDLNAQSFLDSHPAHVAKQTQPPAQPEPIEQTAPEQAVPRSAVSFPAHIFRDYDIRGLYGKEITLDFAKQLGKALACKVLAEGENSIITAFDGRISSPALCKALEEGIVSTGCNVIQAGQIPTPMMNFAVQHNDITNYGVVVTASHNPANDNGFKITCGTRSLKSEEVQELRQAMEQGNFKQGMGQKSSIAIADDYREAITLDVIPATNLKLVVDAGNGIAGRFAPEILEELGCTVIPLYCDVDGAFPNHDPDPLVEDNLHDLIERVKAEQADVGIALDGDGDRFVAVTRNGDIVWPDQLLMIFARDIISREPGADIIFDVKSTRRLNSLISSYGGRPVMWKTGHANIRNKTLENNAPLGGEFSGHIFFRDRWYGFDDAIYAAARLIEIMATREQGLDEIIAGFETSYSTPEIKIEVPEEDKFALVKLFIQTADFTDASTSTIDGIRVDYPEAWGLLRASNTTPALTLRFEANSPEELEKIQALFREQLQKLGANLTF